MKPTAAATQNRPKRRRRVQFETNDKGEVKVSVAAPAHVLDERTLEDCWWKASEHAVFRQNARQVAQSIEDGGDCLFEKGGRRSYVNIIEKVYTHSLTSRRALPNATRKELEFWIQVGHSRRGLERMVASAIGEERIGRRVDVIVEVLQTQYHCWEQRKSAEQTAKLLKTVSERESTFSSRFAEMMGAADAIAVRPATATKVAKQPKERRGLRGITLGSPLRQRRVLNSAA